MHGTAVKRNGKKGKISCSSL